MVGDECVIDVYQKSPDFDGDSNVCIFSSGKSIGAILLGRMRQEGKLDYDAYVKDYWPEHVGKGKEEIKVCDIMRHEGGMPRFHKQFKQSDFFPENIKKNSIGKIIEEDEPLWPLDQKRSYHSCTRDVWANEIFRRVDSKGRTMGEYLKEEVHDIIGTKDIILGATPEELEKIKPFECLGGWMMIKTVFKGPNENYYSMGTMA